MNEIPEIGTPQANWENNAIQFPRLLAEIWETCDFNMDALRESMDCTSDQISDIFERAQAVWDAIKENT